MSADNVTVIFPDSGELPSELAFERTLVIGSFLGCMAWGLHACVYVAAMYFSLVSLGRRQRSPWLSWGFMGYMTVLFALATTFVGTNIQANINAYITHRDYPGGPYIYAFNAFRKPMTLIGNNICPIITILLTDALLVWRLYVIWDVYSSWILVCPAIMLLASTAMGILLLFTSAQPGHTLNSEDAVHVGTAFWSISLSMTVICTLLIVARLIYLQRQAVKALGNIPEYRDHYISAWTILLESSALYTIFGFVYLILYNRNNPVNNIFDSLMAQVVCISSDLIILRIAMGRGWTSQTSAHISALIFNSAHPTTTDKDAVTNELGSSHTSVNVELE